MGNKAIYDRVFRFIDKVIIEIQKETAPICFHCGTEYIKDVTRCVSSCSVWKPNCICIAKPGIRIIT